eukprot:TRINITY_DN5786_c0_g1_i1.p1 TRINITY_DN5786_c0_g1~~TRINITY_DN5786_c0_g1_i1.p1  ORF type:complete len:515 (+),score=85.69 TRINITY_DN5786_c0_g1_i1:1175-2719(+)
MLHSSEEIEAQNDTRVTNIVDISHSRADERYISNPNKRDKFTLVLDFPQLGDTHILPVPDLKILWQRLNHMSTIISAASGLVDLGLDVGKSSDHLQIMLNHFIDCKNQIRDDLLSRDLSSDLIGASGNNDVDTVKFIVGFIKDYGIKELVNCVNSRSETALFLASKYGYEDVVRILLSVNHIDVNIPNIRMITPLQVAANKGHSNIMSLILSYPSVNVNQFKLSKVSDHSCIEVWSLFARGGLPLLQQNYYPILPVKNVNRSLARSSTSNINVRRERSPKNKGNPSMGKLVPSRSFNNETSSSVTFRSNDINNFTTSESVNALLHDKLKLNVLTSSSTPVVQISNSDRPTTPKQNDKPLPHDSIIRMKGHVELSSSAPALGKQKQVTKNDNPLVKSSLTVDSTSKRNSSKRSSIENNAANPSPRVRGRSRGGSLGQSMINIKRLSQNLGTPPPILSPKDNEEVTTNTETNTLSTSVPTLMINQVDPSLNQSLAMSSPTGSSTSRSRDMISQLQV